MFKISRRTLLQGTGAALVTAALSGKAFAAPKRGGNLRIGIAGGTSADSLDPTATPVDSGFLTLNTMRSTLVGMDAKGEVTPNLAESWEPSKDLTQWVFNIRKGATFHSGKTVTADDVVASLNLHRGDKTSSPAKALLDPVTKIEADGANRVVITLNGPNIEFASLLKTDFLVVLPSKDGNIDRASKDGTGPYKLESFEPGQHMRFTRNPNYWDLDNYAFLDSAEVVVIADPAARMNALRSGRVDLVNSVDLKTAAMLKRVAGITLDDIPSGLYYGMPMLTDVAPFNDNNVRLALKYAINRQEIVDKVLLGHGTVGNDHPIFKNVKFSATDIPQREYDPDKARHYLKQAGFDSIDIPLNVAEIGFPGATATGQLFAASAKAAGISLNVTREPDDGYFDRVWLKQPFTTAYWHQAITADARFTEAFLPGAPWNETRFNNARFNELVVTARKTADENTRAGMYHEMQKIIHDEGGLLNPVFANYVWAMKDNVHRPDDVTTLGDLDSFQCIARWWMT
ncbi:ABC transporter substrate-binding protein [Rhizobium leguminosarum bv. trifolii]|uniref:ABC transporter substrate-binding protein n=1 Tax=Rhizobium leguminosarum TaxID=384 RepID=UPI000E2F226B|nr:ABC transporter substrate-binding protein [Rhizobium leguminosarum]RFB87063.1 ABC transporter substrate-binding protein [Rhizobium leguminosarum bv. trifolii]